MEGVVPTEAGPGNAAPAIVPAAPLDALAAPIEAEPRWYDARSIRATGVRIAASALSHVLLILWVAGLLAVPYQSDPEAVPVELVPPDSAPEPPPPKPPAAEKPQPAQPASEPGQKAKDQATVKAAPEPPAPKPANGAGIGSEDNPTALTAQERESLIAQVQRCWKVPSGWTDPKQASATLRFSLNPDGTLNGTPDVVEFHASLVGKAAAENAIRAVRQCGPYHMPAEKYAEWHEVQMRFAP